MYTDDNGIVRFESLDNIAPLQVGLNAALESVSVALDSSTRIWPVANVSERDALGTGTPVKPLFAYRADTGDLEINTGDGWTIYPEPVEVEDTGWLDIPGPSGFSSTGVRRVFDGVAEIRFNLTATSSYSGGGTLTDVATADERFETAEDAWFVAITSTGDVARSRLFATGRVNCYSMPSLSTGQSFYGSITYLVG